jgi:hypothetical protein
MYNPNNQVNTNLSTKYAGNTSNYNDNSYHTAYNYNAVTPSVTYTTTGDQTYKQSFFTAGLDFKPSNRVHFMPNFWYNSYSSQLVSNVDHDMVWRLTFFFSFGKNYDNGGF